MTNLSFYEIHSNITENLQNDMNIQNKSSIIKYLNTDKFKTNLNNILIQKNFSPNALIHILIDYFNEYSNMTENEWLKYIYEWILSKSFPEKNSKSFNKKLDSLVYIYINLLNTFSKFEISSNLNCFLYKYPITFLTKEEELSIKNKDEYLKFKNLYKSNYLFELMKLDMFLTGHNTLEHVAGVNYLSLYIGRQLKKLGVPIDLGIVTGSSLGHDIGKYGVRENELDRVPYLHYFYTEYWFKKYDMQSIGHIATNHSTWDLELENLPIESLILIYCDFRVKNKKVDDEYQMNIFSLDEAFHIILNKLDNLDEKKEKRYKKVYSKLKDFESFIINLGINVDINVESNSSKEVIRKSYPLMRNREVVENIKYFSIEHNIFLMNKFMDDISFNNILEAARSEYNWRKLSVYLQMFREYSTYLTQKQKLTTINFLYDLLLHKEEDIRKEAAEIIGLLISIYDEEYRKEVPENINLSQSKINSIDLFNNCLHLLLYPNHKIAESQGEWLYNIKTIIHSLFINCKKDKYNDYANVLLGFYKNYYMLPDIAQFYLLQTVKYIPISNLNPELSREISSFVLYLANSSNSEIRLGALDIIVDLLPSLNINSTFNKSLKRLLLESNKPSQYPAENYLKHILAEKLDLDNSTKEKYKNFYVKDEENISEIFLKNLKTATKWMNKKINIDILYYQVLKSPEITGLHTAMHFCNLLKVSAVERVRNYAGETLLKIMPVLSLDQKNDVAIELLRALEMQSYQFTKYIPDYLGQLILYLHPGELDEIIDDFEEKIKTSNVQVTFLILKTIGIAIKHYPEYKIRFNESTDKYEKRLIRMLGILLIEMANFDDEVKTEAFRVIGVDVFGSKILSLKEKHSIFQIISKKILTLLPKREENELLFLNNSSALNHIYRFIADYEFHYGKININSKNKIAFFPGTFDPFSLSHKEIAIEIRNLGFEVYLAVDEFSWSKRTQPHTFRKNIMNMSIANEIDIYPFPSETPINLSNREDLKTLEKLFNDSKVYIVVGSDVLLNASFYKKISYIHEFPHIIFNRKSHFSRKDDIKLLDSEIKKIKGDVIQLSLSPQYEDISSTQIRNNIDLNRDISKLIDPLAQKYIYKYGLYLKEPRYKSLLQTKTIEIEIINNISQDFLENFLYLNESFRDNLIFSDSLNLRILLIRNTEDNKILAFSIFHWIRNGFLYDEFKNRDITQYIRSNAKGRIVEIDGVYSLNDDDYLLELILNETLAFCIQKDYNYCIFKNVLTQKTSPSLEENLKLLGFIKTPYSYNENSIFAVDINNPCTLNLDIENILKEPFKSNKRIKNAINKTRKNLKKALCNLFPGELLLSFNKDIVYSKLVQKICDTNNVPVFQEENKILGPYMCVPFGSILNGCIIPNTVTKTMHTEKIFQPNIKEFTIGHYPYYLSLSEQIKMLHSFNRPLILVDDLLHKGYRLNVIEPLIEQANIDIEKIIVGILSGRGKEIMDINNIDVDCAYFIPNLKLWFNESSQYPFLGGDMVKRNMKLESNLLPSINFILPYVSPSFIKNTTNEAIYNLSEISLSNSLKILESIEEEYQTINEKALSLKNLGEILESPRYPDRGKDIKYDMTLKPSLYVKNDLENLKRLENIVKR